MIPDRIESPHLLSRRAFIGWLVALAGGFVALALVGYFSLYHLFRHDIKPETLGRRTRRKNRRRARQEFVEHASVDSGMYLVEGYYPAKQLRHSVIHWQHPAFRRRALFIKTGRRLEVDEALKKAQPRCAHNPSLAASSTTHFYPALESITRESLALSKVQFTSEDHLEGIEEALQILQPLFDDNRQRCNWRMYHLYAHLLCWQETDAKAAYIRLRQDLWKHPGTTPKEIAFIASSAEFEEWHRKRHRKHKKSTANQLRQRIEQARTMTRGPSSNGQDTAQAETTRSNQSGPLSRTGTSTRKIKLDRRRERRKLKRGRADRPAILWHKFLRKLELDTKTHDPEDKPAIRMLPIQKKRREGKKPCLVPYNDYFCIPSRKRLRKQRQRVAGSKLLNLN